MYTIKRKLPSHFVPSIILGALVLFFLASSVGAAGLYDSSINAVVTPENPGPKSTITISLDSPLVNLSRSTISWFVNGLKIKEGRDLRVFQFNLPESGQTKVEARITSTDYGVISKNFSFAPTLVEIIYEANSFTPPFYRGKALIPPEGVVTLLARPDFKTASAASAKNFIYTWTKDGVVDGANSGLGKNTYIYNNGRLSEDAPLIEVVVTSTDNNLRGYATFRARSVAPEIIFYEDNPLLGVTLNQKIPENYFLSKQEVTFIAYPYFFGGKNADSENLQYKWLINSSPVSGTGNSKTLLTVRRPEESGSSSISLNLENQRRIFQTARTNIMIEYGN